MPDRAPRVARGRGSRSGALRVVAAIALAAGMLAAVPAVHGGAGGDGAVVLAHSQMLASAPSPGAVLARPPAEIRLVFSEPLEPGYSSLDLLDAYGVKILRGLGQPDPADPRVLVAPMPPGRLAARALYGVSWRTLSAADGHWARGTFSFGIGDVAVGGIGLADSAKGDALHPGHPAVLVVAETVGRTLGYVGSMVPFGMAVLTLLVLRARPGRGRRIHGPDGTASQDPPVIPPRTAGAIAVASGALLAAAAAGSAILLGIGAWTLDTQQGPTPPEALVIGSRSVQLLAARLVVAAAAAAAILVLRRRLSTRTTLVIAGASCVGILGLTAAGSHASAFASPVPVAVDLVHLVAASSWVGGLVLLAGLAVAERRHTGARGLAVALVPRFTPVALVSVALVGLSGVYASWAMTGSLLSTDSPYEMGLALKIAVFVGAIGIGAANLLDGGRGRSWLGGLSRRVMVEAGLAAVVIVVAASLTTGSPPGADRAIAIAPAAAGGRGPSLPIGLGLRPGRPGPNVVLVDGIPAGDGLEVSLVMRGLDTGRTDSRVRMRPDRAAGRPLYVSDVTLAASSRWEATVVVVDAAGNERGRSGFVFTLDPAGVVAGRRVPPVDPEVLLAVLLVGLSVLGLSFALAGGVLPHSRPETSRPALIAASATGLALGLAIVTLPGPR
jgi:copper transport protein